MRIPANYVYKCYKGTTPKGGQMEFTLMNKDVEVIGFHIIRRDNGSAQTANLDIRRADLVPYGFTGSMLKFVEGRKAPRNRGHICALLKEMGSTDIESFIKVSNAASLTDTFWIRDEANRKTWRNVSLYKNDFERDECEMAELTMAGDFPKCWVRTDGQLYLLKRGSETYGREVFAEFYASQVAEEICTQPVTYDLKKQNGHLSTECEIFTSEATGFSQMTWHVKNPYNVTPSEALAIMEQYGDGDNFRRMMVLDALTLNIDRHLGNFGLLINNDTLEPLGMAPEFDNNRSMLYNFSDEKFADTDMNRLLDIEPRFEGGEFNLIANDMLTPEIKADLKNMTGFRFRRHESYNWSEARLTKFEEFIHRQIEKILNRTTLYMS